ncbi:PREDICTED: torsin-1A-interacting protein 1-like [Branchiostoma belcheri]|uniref:Torsin-1A-interacting protein 1-like n=1 Tax=Branchiostoma belcheri TaxID=7741 RepID=A0A6P4Z8I8_BRABE|nr:PREDICTED: torsin-1A-interacting protein 1-like [Branchiostoma belcheri]
MDRAHAESVVEDVMSTLGGRSNSLVILNSAENMPMYIIDSLGPFCSSLPIQRSIVITAPDTTPSVTLPACGKKTILRVQTEATLQLLPTVTQSTDDHHTALNAIREVFVSQSDRVWMAADAVMTEHRTGGPPRRPAVLIIGAPPGAHRTADVLAEALAKVYSEKPLMIDSHQFSRVDADRAKLHIDRTLDSTFLGDVRSAVFTRVDSLPGPAAMIFHSYCDHDDAQFKNVAYFMTVHCSDDVDTDSPPKAQEEAILDYLKRSWEDLHKEKRGPLLSRIASMVVVVKAEKNMEVLPAVKRQ